MADRFATVYRPSGGSALWTAGAVGDLLQAEFFGAAPAGPSTVQTAADLAWSVRVAASTSRSAAWTVRALVQTTKPSAWSVRTSASASASIAWTARAVVSATASSAWSVRIAAAANASAAWSVLNAVAVGATRPLAWSVRVPVAASRAAAWAVRTSAAAEKPAAWSVREFIDASAPLGWTVQANSTLPSRLRLGPAQPIARAPWAGASAAAPRPAFRPAQRLAVFKAARIGPAQAAAAQTLHRRAPVGRPVRGKPQ